MLGAKHKTGYDCESLLACNSVYPMQNLLTAENGYIFRITHRDNLPWILENDVHCRSSDKQDPKFVNIGNPEVIEKRKTVAVSVEPHGTLSDYVSFYFTPFSPMALNIKTGYNGIKQRNNEEILILHTSISKLVVDKVTFIFADRNAALAAAKFSSDPRNLAWLDWRSLQTRDFKKDYDNLEKFERYQAEALIHEMLPVSSLITVACYDKATLEEVTKIREKVGVQVNIEMKPGWYF
jgi:hypothetical protein